jgi:hypothetical protein
VKKIIIMFRVVPNLRIDLNTHPVHPQKQDANPVLFTPDPYSGAMGYKPNPST